MPVTKKISDKMIPLSLTVVLLALDQITKYFIVKFIPPFSIGASFFGNFLRIIHVNNSGIAFSVGDTLPVTIRSLLFSAAPLAVLIIVLVIYFRNQTFTTLQRWCICGIIGGGFGNLSDRIFRPEGVIDFIDIKFYGIFGLDRWPTFNIADMSVIICGTILVLSFIITISREDTHD
jgi:signal peptidase II